MIMISTTIFQNITEKLENMTHFVFQIFGGCYCRPRSCMPPMGMKRCYKLQQIISKHKQAYVLTAI